MVGTLQIGGEYNYHLYYSKSNNTLQINAVEPGVQPNCRREEIVLENNINTVKVSKDGIYLNDIYCELPVIHGYGQTLYEELKNALNSETTIQVGSQEGNTRSNATYEYIKVVRKES